MIRLLALFLFLPSLLFAGQGMGPGPGMPASAGGGYFSDTFTAADSTALATHDSGYTSIDATFVVTNLEINSNLAENTAEFVWSGAFHDGGGSAPTTDAYTEAVTWDKNDGTRTMSICNRVSTSNFGYCANLNTASAGNWTRFDIYRNNVSVDSLTGLTYAHNATHVIYIKSVTNGSQVDVSVWIDDNTGAADRVYNDTNAARILSGWPGFFGATNSSYIPTIDDLDTTPW